MKNLGLVDVACFLHCTKCLQVDNDKIFNNWKYKSYFQVGLLLSCKKKKIVPNFDSKLCGEKTFIVQ